MKKVLLLIVCICLVFLNNSCKSTEVEPVIDSALADAAGAYEGAIISLEAGFGEACPLCGGIFAGIYAATASFATASILPIGQIPGEYKLPSEMEVNSNPYEDFGRLHNDLLHYSMLKKGNDNLFLENDNIDYAINKATEYNIIKDKALISNKLKNEFHNISKQYLTSLSKYHNVSISYLSAFDYKSSKFSADYKESNQYLMNIEKELKRNNNLSIKEKIEFINHKIEENLNLQESLPKKLKLMYLTVYKHSSYFNSKVISNE
jgi:hypothetical protein